MKLEDEQLNTKSHKKQSSFVGSEALNRSDFNFELWVKQVKPQMLAALQRRSSH